MSDTEPQESFTDWSSLGLVANPFTPTSQSSTDPYWMRLVIHAATNRLHAGVLRASGAEDRRPIVVEMPDDVPDYYYLAAENAYLGRTGADPGMNTLAANIGLDMMRLGRIRGTMAELAELVGAVEFDLTLAAYAAAALREPDTTLAQYAPLADLDVAALAERFAAEPKETADRYFGQPEYSRLEDDVAADMVLREAYDRSSRLDPDPLETEESPEDVVGETDTVPMALDEEPQEEDTEGASIAAVREYVIAHARTHLSPVIARAMKAYVDNGFGALAQELKVTKAPKKTLGALIRFEHYRFDTVVLIYDRFDPWNMLEDDARSTALGGLAELRWVVTRDGVMVLMLAKDACPEIDEQFASATRIDWSMRGLIPLQNGETGFDADLAQYWIDSASLNIPASIQVNDPLVAPVVEAANDDVVLFAGMMALAVEDAASRGLPRLDERAIEAALHRETKG